MERQKYIYRSVTLLLTFLLITLPLLLEAQSINSQSTTHRKAIYDAYIAGQMDQWVPVMQEIENMPSLTTDKKLELINYYYGYAGYLIDQKENKTAGNYVKKGEKLIDEILKENPKNASALAYKGSFISFKMFMNRIKAVALGPESMRYINRAYKTDPQNIQAIVDKGNLLYYAPVMFGGDKEEGLTFFEKAITQMEATQGATVNNWFYLNLLTLLARHYEERKEYVKAGETYRKILRVEPNFTWVKNELYPEFQKKHPNT